MINNINLFSNNSFSQSIGSEFQKAIPLDDSKSTLSIHENSASKCSFCHSILYYIFVWPFVKIYEFFFSLFTSSTDPLDISGSRWLDNTNHIFHYVIHLASKYPDKFISTLPLFYESENVIEFVNRNAEKGKDLVALVNLRKKHWGLVYIDRRKKTVEFYDSKVDYEKPEKIRKDLTCVVERLNQIENLTSDNGYRLEMKINQELQPDGYQCGVWVLYFLATRLKNPDIDFNEYDIDQMQDVIADYREKVQKVIREVDTITKTNDAREKEYYIKRDGNDSAQQQFYKDNKLTYFSNRLRLYLGNLTIPLSESETSQKKGI